jgi:hypothetical protein
LPAWEFANLSCISTTTYADVLEMQRSLEIVTDSQTTALTARRRGQHNETYTSVLNPVDADGVPRQSGRTPSPGEPSMSDLSTPDIVDRVVWQRKIDELRLREKAHTREGDEIAAARRRLPMVEVDASTPVVGAHGEVPLIDVFEGRSQLFA